MRFTLILLGIAAPLAVLLLFLGGELLALAMVGVLMLALPVFVLEALITLGGALRFFGGGHGK